jgi:hypothetical protein
MSADTRRFIDPRSLAANAESRPGNPDCTGVTETCQRDSGECMVCGHRDCPFGEPLHWHHDGCPVCDGEFGGDVEAIELAACSESDRASFDAWEAES